MPGVGPPLGRRLLGRLLRTPGVAVPPGELVRVGWNLDTVRPEPSAVATLKKYVYRLRCKLGDIGVSRSEGQILFKITGHGYGVITPDAIRK